MFKSREVCLLDPQRMHKFITDCDTLMMKGRKR